MDNLFGTSHPTQIEKMAKEYETEGVVLLISCLKNLNSNPSLGHNSFRLESLNGVKWELETLLFVRLMD